jgi:putative CocE/NonD family hydrolase
MADHHWDADLPADKHTHWSSQKELFVAMRDGVRLSTDVLLPDGAAGKLPAVLVRTPYDKDRGEGMVTTKWVEFFLRQGYAVVLQNERGFFFSEGTFTNYLRGASTDGYDTVEWIVNQLWSNGKVGTIGCSSSAEHQWPLAAGNHAGHVAMIPAASGTAVGNIPGNDTRGAFYRSGVPVFGPWAGWYGGSGISERPLLPTESTPEQRIRLRNRFSLLPPPDFNPADPAKLMHLPSKDVLREVGGPLTPFDNYITWTPADPRWDEVEQIGAGAAPRVPALHINTWHDIAICETTRLFNYLQDLETPDQYLIIGPGPHCIMSAEPPYNLQISDLRALLARFGAARLDQMPDRNMADLTFGDLAIGDARYRGADRGYVKLFLAWFDHWLKGEPDTITAMPKVQLFVMGQGWVNGDRWPLGHTHFTTYFLSGDPVPPMGHESGTLTTTSSSQDHVDSYLYDPTMPVPSIGGGLDPATARDQRPIEARKDVLVYSSAPLEQPVTIAGPIEVVLYVSSSAKDTDFIVKLIDVYPDGKAINLSDDAFRVRYRDGFDQMVPMQPGEIYKITLSNMVTAVRFAAGHRIRLHVTSSNFPVYERNLNTGGNNYDETTAVVARNSLHHGPGHPSHLVLPVLSD